MTPDDMAAARARLAMVPSHAVTPGSLADDLRVALAAIDERDAEIVRLIENVNAALEPKLRKVCYENGSIDIEMEENLGMSLLADMLLKCLDDHKAENYVQVVIETPDTGAIRAAMSVMRPGMKSPHELRVEAEAKLAERDSAVELVRAYVESPRRAEIGAEYALAMRDVQRLLDSTVTP